MKNVDVVSLYIHMSPCRRSSSQLHQVPYKLYGQTPVKTDSGSFVTVVLAWLDTVVTDWPWLASLLRGCR